MRPETLKRLFDMREAADAVARFTAGKTAADFATNDLLRSGVYDQLAIIGEALSKVRQTDPAAAAQVGEYDRIIGFRNQIIHGYDHLDDTITWRVVEEKLPVLRRELDAMLGPPPPPSP